MENDSHLFPYLAVRRKSAQLNIILQFFPNVGRTLSFCSKPPYCCCWCLWLCSFSLLPFIWRHFCVCVTGWKRLNCTLMDVGNVCWLLLQKGSRTALPETDGDLWKHGCSDVQLLNNTYSWRTHLVLQERRRREVIVKRSQKQKSTMWVFCDEELCEWHKWRCLTLRVRTFFSLMGAAGLYAKSDLWIREPLHFKR